MSQKEMIKSYNELMDGCSAEIYKFSEHNFTPSVHYETFSVYDKNIVSITRATL